MYYFPPSILPKIETLRNKETFAMDLGNVDVHFTFSSAKPLDRRIPEAAAEIVRYLWPYRKCVDHSFVAEFFWCNAPKRLPQPGAILEEDHVNTGYSFPCKSLVVFRQQEWFKVFIHECFHYLGLDKGVAGKVRLDMFTIPIQVSVREAYCETWARIIQSDYLGGLSTERNYAVSNMVRVLRHMGLTYTDLWGEEARNYAEKTNVFAYVVLTAILLHDPPRFIDAFPRFECNVPKLLQLVRANYRAPSFLRRVRKAENEPSESGPFHMSGIEFTF